MPKQSVSIRGMSLLEVMLTLAVAAIMLILAVQYYSNVKLNAKITQTVKQIGVIVDGTSTLIQAQLGKKIAGSKANLADTLITGAYVAPADIMNPWLRGRPYTIRLIQQPAPNLQITILGMSNVGCTRFKERLQQPFPRATITGCNAKTPVVAVLIPIL